MGSTSVPGLRAKPVIDIMGLVWDLKKVEDCRSAFERLGYKVLEECGIPGRRYMRRGGDGTPRTHHVHLYQFDDSRNILKDIAFREFLRCHPEQAAAYGAMKTGWPGSSPRTTWATAAARRSLWNSSPSRPWPGSGGSSRRNNRDGGKVQNALRPLPGTGGPWRRAFLQEREESHGREAGPRGTAAQCPVYRKCGGCQLQNMSYERQLIWKQDRCRKLLGKFGKVLPILGMERPYHYRNKVQAAFAFDKKHNKIISGVYQSSSHWVVPVDSCLTEDETADRIIVDIRGLIKDFKLTAYDENTGRGFLRHVLVKRGFGTGEVMVVLVTGTPVFPGRTTSSGPCGSSTRRSPPSCRTSTTGGPPWCWGSGRRSSSARGPSPTPCAAAGSGSRPSPFTR